MIEPEPFNDVELYPAWKQAVRQIQIDAPKYGDLLTHAYLFRLLRVEMPTEATLFGAAQKAQLEYVRGITKLREHMLVEMSMDLETVPGEGYRIVLPGQQTSTAERDGMDEVRRAIRKMGRRLVHVALDQLNPAQRRENADALARFAQMRGMVKQIAHVKTEAAE